MSKQLDQPEGAPSPSGSSLGIGTVWRGVRRYPIASSLVVVAAIVLGGATWLFLPLPKMTAYAIFQVSAQPQSLLTPVGDAKADFALYCQSQAALIKSRQVLNGALNQPGVANLGLFKGEPDKIAWLENKLKVDFKTSPEFMRLSVEGDEGDDMKTVIEAITNVYTNDVLSKDRTQRAKKLRQLEDVHLQYTDKLDDFQKDLGKIAEGLASTDPANLVLKDKFALEQLGAAQKEQMQYESELRRADVDIRKYEARVEAGDNADVPDETFNAAIKFDLGYQKLEVKKAGIVESISQIKRGLRPDAPRNPRLVLRQEELADVEKEISDYVAAIRPELTAKLRDSSLGENKRQLELLNYKKAELIDLIAAVKSEIAKLEKKIQLSADGQLQLERIHREMGRIERTADLIQQHIEELRPELLSPSRVSIFEDPVVIPGIEGNRRLKYSLLAFGGVLLLGVGLITFVEVRNRRVVSTKDASADLGLQLIGTVPSMPRPSRRDDAKTATQIALWQTMLTESVDSTRTMLVHSLDGRKSGLTIAVTSAMPEEGKTMLASQLSASLARAGFRTLLVDGDMRRPTLHQIYEGPRTPGLSELLRGECSPQDAIRASSVKGLSFMPAGEWDQLASQSLSTERWRTLKAKLESSFDYVVIDTSPLLLVADPLLIAKHADGTVISVLRNVSQIDSIIQARDRLTALSVKILGVVVNGIEEHGYRAPYYRDNAQPASTPSVIAESDQPPVSSGLAPNKDVH